MVEHHGGNGIIPSSVTVTGGALTAAIPTSTAADIAFKIISPAGVAVAPVNSSFTINSKQVITYDHGALHLAKPLLAGAVITITTVAGPKCAL